MNNFQPTTEEKTQEENTPSRYNNDMPLLREIELLEEQEMSFLASKKEGSTPETPIVSKNCLIPKWDTACFKVTSLGKAMIKKNKMVMDKGGISERTKGSLSLEVTYQHKNEQQNRDLSFLGLKPKSSPNFARKVKLQQIDRRKIKSTGQMKSGLRLPSALFEGDHDCCSDSDACSMEEIQVFERSNEDDSEETGRIEGSFYTPNLSLRSNAPNFTDVCNFREFGC